MKENINLVNEAICFIANKLNSNNINFYIVGAIGAYIDANIPLQRIHDDLDLMIEEKDVDKLKEIFENSDYTFYDKRFTPNKFLNKYGFPDGDHEVYAKHKEKDFHIGFFLYYYDEKAYTICEYFKENNTLKKLERTLPIEIFNYQYNNTPIQYMGSKVKVARKELICKNKLIMNREKDLFDIKNIEPVIDHNILNGLKNLSKIRKTKTINL